MPGAEIGEDVAEHVLRDEDVEGRRPLDEVERGGVDVDRFEHDLRMGCRDLVRHLPEEGIRGENVGLVDAGHT